MTKEITKSIILQELTDKFKLREFAPAKFLFDETVVPTYDIGPHLIKTVLKTNTLTITGTGGREYFPVPENEKWFLHRYNIIFLTGAFTIAGAYLAKPGIADYLYMDLAPAISVSYAVNLPYPAMLEPGEDIAINVDGYTTTGNLEMRIGVTVEEIR